MLALPAAAAGASRTQSRSHLLFGVMADVVAQCDSTIAEAERGCRALRRCSASSAEGVRLTVMRPIFVFGSIILWTESPPTSHLCGPLEIMEPIGTGAPFDNPPRCSALVAYVHFNRSHGQTVWFFSLGCGAHG